MKHAASRELFAYWDGSRRGRLLPERSDIEPRRISRILGHIFILDADGGYAFRLAGTRLCALFGRELRGACFLDLWHPQSREAIADLLATGRAEAIGTAASVRGSGTDGREVMLELVLLPLHHHGRVARVIGSLAPLNVPFWLDAVPVETLSLGAFRHLGPAIGDSHLPDLATPLPAPRPRLIVHEGGRRP
jgi:hypothetical protein